MSGPKIVRVVTREEIIAVCRGRLARLDRALAAWTKEGRRHEMVNDEDVAAAQRRRDQIAVMIEQDRFLDLQKSVPDEIAFLKADQQARLERAALTAARARTASRREEEAAAALLGALRRANREVPTDLDAKLEAAAQGKGGAAVALSAGFALLSAPSSADRTRIQALAQSLKGQAHAGSVQDWLSQQPPSKDELPLARIETGLAELITFAGPEAAAPYEARLSALRGGAGADRRSLLLDSLALDLGKTLSEVRTTANLQAKLELAIAELAILSIERADHFSSRASTKVEIEVRLRAVEAAITAETQLRAAASRRQAVLKGLAALGYEVGEQMSTAWVKDGRIVMRKPAQPGYGIEVAGGADAERLQMRVVAFGESSADPARDRDAETLWCGDVTALQASLAASGAALIIDRASASGTAPVKRVAAGEGDSRTEARVGPAMGSKTLR